MLREDLLACPRAVGSSSRAFLVEEDTCSFTTLGLPPLHPRLASREPQSMERAVVWSRLELSDGSYALARSVDPYHLATGSVPEPTAEILLRDLALLHFTALVGANTAEHYDSDSRDGMLPTGIEIRYARHRRDGSSGPEQVRFIPLPQVRLDPLQAQDY
jgi:hypothetical protein